MTSTRTEVVYVSRSVVSGFEALAMLAAGDAPADAPLACADAMMDLVLRDYLNTIPELVERKRAIRKALAEIDAQFTRKPEEAA